MVVVEEEGKAITSERLVRFLARKGKKEFREERTRIADKLRRQERLTDSEFWSVYSSMQKDGPEVSYRNLRES